MWIIHCYIYIKLILKSLSLVSVHFKVLSSIPIILDCLWKDHNLIQYAAFTWVCNLDYMASIALKYTDKTNFSLYLRSRYCGFAVFAFYVILYWSTNNLLSFIRQWLKIFLTEEIMMMMLWDNVRNCWGINRFLYSVYDIYTQPSPWWPIAFADLWVITVTSNKAF